MAHVKRSVFHRERKEKLAESEIKTARATAKYLRLSPRKGRSVTNAIKGKQVDEALRILDFSPKKAAKLVQKVLQSAIANAQNNFNLNVDSLYVTEAVVNDGPRMKRIWQRGRGRADMIQKRLCHISVAVTEKNS